MNDLVRHSVTVFSAGHKYTVRYRHVEDLPLTGIVTIVSEGAPICGAMVIEGSMAAVSLHSDADPLTVRIVLDHASEMWSGETLRMVG